jgi:hypothetical protein
MFCSINFTKFLKTFSVFQKFTEFYQKLYQRLSLAISSLALIFVSIVVVGRATKTHFLPLSCCWVFEMPPAAVNEPAEIG